MQALHHVGTGQVVGGGGQGDARHARIALVQQGQLAVFGAKVVAPLAHAMRLVNGKQGQLPLGVQGIEQAQKARRDQPLRGHVQQRDLPALQAPFDLLRLLVGLR